MDDSWTKRAALVDALAEAIAAAVRDGEVAIAEQLLRIVRARGTGQW